MSAKQVIRTSFHVSAFVMYLVAIIRHEFLPPIPFKSSHEHFAGRLKYLTYWNLWMQFVYFGFSTYVDQQKPSSSSHLKMTRLRDKLFSSIAMPYALFVFSVFWILYAINRELVFPQVLDAIYPTWLNHVSHTLIVPVLLVETWLLKHRHPRRRDGITITILFGVIYIAWILFLGHVMDVWPYPILKILDWGMRLIFFGVCFGILLATYILGEKINNFIWQKGSYEMPGEWPINDAPS